MTSQDYKRAFQRCYQNSFVYRCPRAVLVMAEKVLTATETLQWLQEQVTCPACQDHYTQPRTLPCLHSFCHDCIVHFPVTVDEDSRLITCPVCRQLATVQQDAGFPASFLVKYFLEIHDLLEKVVGSQVTFCDNCHEEQAIGYCKQCAKLLCLACVDMHMNHQILSLTDVIATASSLVPLEEHPTMQCAKHGRPLNLYCDTCSKLICQFCTRHHSGHHFQPLTDAFPKHRQQIENHLKEVNENLATITTAAQTLESQEERFLEHIQAVRTEIEDTVQQQVEFLKESERKLMKELEQVVNAYSEKMSACKDEAIVAITRLKSCKEFAEEELRIGNHQEILQSKKQLVKRMKAVCSQVQEDNNFQPPEETRVTFEKNSDLCSNLGSLVKCDQPAVHDDEAIYTPDDWLFSHQLIPVPEDSRADIFSRKAKQAFRGLYDPCGIVCTEEGHLIVVEEGRHCITVINIANREVIRRIGQQGRGESQFSSPEGVSLTQDGHIVVADSSNHRLQVFTTEGAFISSIGSKGTRPLQFKTPWGIAVHQTGKLFVTERDGNRVQVLCSDLSYSHCFGRKGAQLGKFNQPSGIATDSDGMVYVADHGNKRVQKFTPDGNIIVVIDSKNEEMGLKGPYGVCVGSGGTLYVTEMRGNTVCVFNSSGEFQGYIGEDDGSSFRYPRYITTDRHGTVYISDDYGITPY